VNDKRMQLERHGWIAAVAVLSTSMVWLAALNLALLAKAHGFEWYAVLVAIRAVVKVAVRVAELGLPLALLGAFLALVTALSLLTPRPAGGERSNR
jgi:hypothetical protein